MITEQAHRERVDRLLDERRDPFEDEQVLAALVERPERVQALRELLARLEALPTLPQAAPRGARGSQRKPRRVALVLRAAGVLVLASGAVALGLRLLRPAGAGAQSETAGNAPARPARPARPNGPSGPLASPLAVAPAPRLLSWSIEEAQESPGRRRTRRWDARGASDRLEERPAPGLELTRIRQRRDPALLGLTANPMEPHR